MLRLVIENVLLFLTPTLLYVGYTMLRRQFDDGQSAAPDQSGQGANPAAQPPSALNDAPFVWLALAGAVLVFLVLFMFGSMTSGNPGGTYRPAVFKDGKIIPGEIK
jgi:H+/Cl- antiporter ClcA